MSHNVLTIAQETSKCRHTYARRRLVSPLQQSLRTHGASPLPGESDAREHHLLIQSALGGLLLGGIYGLLALGLSLSWGF